MMAHFADIKLHPEYFIRQIQVENEIIEITGLYNQRQNVHMFIEPKLNWRYRNLMYLHFSSESLGNHCGRSNHTSALLFIVIEQNRQRENKIHQEWKC